MDRSTTSYFDTPGRSTPFELAAQATSVRAAGIVTAILEGLPSPICVLNEHRQIVVANQAAAELLGRVGGQTHLQGLRLGEALKCVNVAHGPDGCGTAPQCRHCGAGQVNRAFGVAPGDYGGEVRLRSGAGAAEQAVTLSVHLSPLRLNGSVLRLCALSDLTAVRRREALEHIFFHDVLNTAQAVHGAAELIPIVDDDDEQDQLARVVSENAQVLIGEIQTQRDLLAAEDGTLTVARVPVRTSAMAARVADLYRHDRCSAGRVIAVEAWAQDDPVDTSAVHLSRCIGNLVKNALEASRDGDTVRVRVTASADAVSIDVNNPAVMPADVQAQVFQRSFSTKATAGRGLGTYSVRLLVTRYLGGTVSFVSSPGQGTTFTIRLPRKGENS